MLLRSSHYQCTKGIQPWKSYDKNKHSDPMNNLYCNIVGASRRTDDGTIRSINDGNYHYLYALAGVGA